MLQSLRRYVKYRKTFSSRRVFLTTTSILFALCIIILINSPRQTFSRLKFFICGTEIACYRNHILPTLPDILDEDLTLPDNSIFFHETSCRSSETGRIMLDPRQACAVESAAFQHSNRMVYLLFTSPGYILSGFGDTSEVVINALLQYPNIKLRHLDFARYVNQTPLENLYSSGAIELSWYAGSHASDILRYLTLWRYGGVYLDLDVVITKKLDDLGENYAGSESDENVAAGIIGLSAKNDGHKWASQCINDLKTGFSGEEWGRNGPGVITRLVKSLCGVNKTMDMLTHQCQGFKIMPPAGFYPIPWWNWTMYFDEKMAKKTMDLVRDSYAIHVWNKHSHNRKVVAQSAYAKVAKKNCPKVFSSLVEGKF